MPINLTSVRHFRNENDNSLTIWSKHNTVSEDKKRTMEKRHVDPVE
jgi:hypothetical protein